MSGNPLKGETPFEAGGSTYTLVLDVDALCTLENKLDKSLVDIVNSLNRSPRLGFIRSMLWAGLQTHHKGITEKAAGDLIPLMGGLPGAAGKIGEAISNAFSPPEDNEPERPRMEADGTGSASTVNGSSSDASGTSGDKPPASLN
jgi:hypothetical protein